MNTTEDKH